MRNFKIDVNCDMGEGIGPANGLPWDRQLMDFVSSINIACGYHAGGHVQMHETVSHAVQKGVAIGVHPGLLDRVGFGRHRQSITLREVYQLTLYQIGALYGFVKAAGGRLAHVKPHGALYNMAAEDNELAGAIAQAVFDFDPTLHLFGLSGSQLIVAGQAIGLRTVNEVFADRTYQADGSLTARTQQNSLITDPVQMQQQVGQFIKNQRVTAIDGTILPLHADTICVHGDGPNALVLLQSMHAYFQENNISIQAYE